MPFIPSAGELKTKPTQHSVRELRAIGIQPDILLCRTDRPIPRSERKKLALFCNVRESAVIEARDVDNIYAVPEAYHAGGLDDEVLAAFGIENPPPPDLATWHLINERIRNPEGDVTIAIVGKYTGMKDAYKSLIEALSHGGIANKVKVKLDWIESEVFENEDPAPFLEHVDGILVPGGFGQRGAEGKIRAAQFARERQVPYFGICFGMQMAVIEAARNLCGIEQANSTEFVPTSEPVVGLMTEWMKGNELQKRGIDGDLGGTMRLGAYPAVLQRGSRVADIYHGDRNFRAPPPPLRGQHRLQGPPGAARHALLRHVAGRPAAGDHRVRRPSLVHRRAIPPRAEIAAVRAASAVLVLHRGGGGAEPAGVISACRFPPRCRLVAGHRRLRNKSSGGIHDLRIAHLFLHPRPAAGAAQAVRRPHLENLGQARHQAGRLLDRAGRRRQPRSALHAGLGLARRPREEMEYIPGRSGVA